MNRTFDVWRYQDGVKRWLGVVTSNNHTQADKRASNLYGHGVWTTEKQVA